MIKLRLQISVLVFLLSCFQGFTQNTYDLRIRSVDKDSAFLSTLHILNVFPSQFACAEYISKLPGYLQSKGYVTASIDSVHYDSAFASITLYIGDAYLWAAIDTKHVDPALLNAVGWQEKTFQNKPMDFKQVQLWEEKILSHLESSGHPFAKIYLDSLQLTEEKVFALMKVDKGPLYRIDSIRVYGNAKISNYYLQRYLDIPNNSIYNKEKLVRISKKLKELTYVEEERP